MQLVLLLHLRGAGPKQASAAEEHDTENAEQHRSGEQLSALVISSHCSPHALFPIVISLLLKAAHGRLMRTLRVGFEEALR